MGFKTAFWLAGTCVLSVGCVSENFFEKLPAKSDPAAAQGTSPSGDAAGGSGTSTDDGSAHIATSDRFNVPSVRKADILFVVDNSGSMAGEQATLASSFAGFISSFATQNVNANIGVISTDVRAANGTSGTWTYTAYSNYPQAGPGRLLSRNAQQRFLNTGTATDIVTRFRENVNLGTGGSGDERALDSLHLALDPAMVSEAGFNHGFVRDDSLLVTVIVGDEDNGLSPNEFSSANAQLAIDRTLAAVNALKTGRGGSRFEFVVNKALARPSTLPTYLRTACSGGCPELSYPAVFRQFAVFLGIPESGLIDIQSDFTAELAAMGESVATQAQKQFALSRVPSLAGGIRVEIDGTEIAQDAANGWVYVASSNSIELNGAALQASLGHLLGVDYLGN